MTMLRRGSLALILLLTVMMARASSDPVEPTLDPTLMAVAQAVESLHQLWMDRELDAARLRGVVDAMEPEQRDQFLGSIVLEGEEIWPAQFMLSFLVVDARGEADRLRIALDLGVEMTRLATTDTQRGYWLAWLSRQRLLTATQPELARLEALQARELGTRLCVDRCGPVVENWLNGDEPIEQSLPARQAVFDPRPGRCIEDASHSPYDGDPGAYSDSWLQALLDRGQDAVGSELRQWWQRQGTAVRWVRSP